MNRTWNQDKTLLESADATHIQFAFDKTWRLLSSVYLSDPKGCHFKGELLIDDPENTAAITYCVSYPLEPGSSTSLVIYNAVRRYVEKDSVVFVWRVQFDGLYSDEHAWLVVRPTDLQRCCRALHSSSSRTWMENRISTARVAIFS